MNDFSNNHCLPPQTVLCPISRWSEWPCFVTRLQHQSPWTWQVRFPSIHPSTSFRLFFSFQCSSPPWPSCGRGVVVLPLARRHRPLIFPGAKHLTPVAAAVCVCVERLQWVCPRLREKRRLNVCLPGNIEIFTVGEGESGVQGRRGRGGSKCVRLCD